MPSKEELTRELDWLEEKLSLLDSPLVFCHNDLLLANILYDESKHSIYFIDFEYAAPNYQVTASLSVFLCPHMISIKVLFFLFLYRRTTLPIISVNFPVCLYIKKI